MPMKKILTIILDGFGMREDIYGNAVKMAGMNNFINIWNNYPHCLLKSSGLSVGLPENQCGSSEFGHELIGTGREIENKISKINSTFKKSDYKFNPKYNEMVDYLKRHPEKNLHLCILLSDGGVSSHIEHLKLFLNELNNSKVDNNIYIQAISDGRDANKFSLKGYLEEISSLINVKVNISSVCGRCYALDVTNDYKRTKMYYDLLIEGRGVEANNLSKVVEKCYEKKISDEYLPPIKTKQFSPINNGDVLMLYHGFYIKINPLKNIQREKKNGTVTECDGFRIEIFSDSSEKIMLDSFTAAVGFEILKNDTSDAEEFARDVVESEEKGYLRMV
jgi:2,3-bisphosphoglycerate-independent phosphoglycerate mutase